jgi:hypothetical protein
MTEIKTKPSTQSNVKKHVKPKVFDGIHAANSKRVKVKRVALLVVLLQSIQTNFGNNSKTK